MRGNLILVAMVVLPAAGCGRGSGGGAWKGTVDTTASGVVVVRNTGGGLWDSASAWRLEEEVRIGGAGDSGPGGLANPRTMEVDPAGRIYVIESQPEEVRVYGADGRYVRTLMRTGSGPGEVSQAVGLAWDTLGHLWVVDQRNARFTVFDTSGARLAEHRRAVSGFFTWKWAGAITRAGEIIDITMAPSPGEFRLAALRLDSAFGVRDTLALPYFRGPAFEIHDRGRSIRYSVPFAPTLTWLLEPRGYVWSSTRETYRIVQQRLGGDTVRVIEREVEPVRVSAAEKDEAMRGLDSFVKQGGTVDRAKIPDVKPPFGQLWVDDRGYLWVERSKPAGARGSRLDVFDPDGRLLGEMTTDFAPLQAVLIRGPALYAISSDENDEPVILRFRVRGR